MKKFIPSIVIVLSIVFLEVNINNTLAYNINQISIILNIFIFPILFFIQGLMVQKENLNESFLIFPFVAYISLLIISLEYKNLIFLLIYFSFMKLGCFLGIWIYNNK
ncbi:hypothetical protein KGF51_18875 [Clostridioides sp. ZZV14-6045]|uniref:hypothetical protein n=1 Tax=Clostridioides sp. ZZV14-6045 TaxID=2811489 RepID=UPI001D11818F|nr:hypothetical protein [Clostridioides sp. ZZV14-6045]